MWPGRAERQPLLVEVTPSRWDDEPITRSRALLSGLAGTEGLSLEFVARPRELRFYLRADSEETMDAAIDAFRAAYPQAGLRQLSLEGRPYADPAWAGPGETCRALALRLSRDSALPLFTGIRSSDPLPGVLAAAAGVTGAERVVAQLVLTPVPDGWQQRVQARAETRPQYRREESAGGMGDILPLMGLLGVGAAGLQGYEWYQEGQLLALAGLSAGSMIGLPLALALASRLLNGREPLAADLIEEKLGSPGFSAELRVLAFGHTEASRKRLDSLAGRVADAYRGFDHPLGNGLRPHGWRGDPRSLQSTHRVLPRTNVLNAAELAVLWHLPPSAAGLATPVESAAHHLLPPEDGVVRGCRVGASIHQGQHAPAYLPHGLLFRNQLVVAKTRRGKSTLLIHLASHLTRRMADGRERLLLVVVDPHQDLAETVLGLVPPGLDERVAYLNLADRSQPVGLNLLDVALFPDRDRTAENVVTMLHRLWPDNWGPRMEGALRASVLALHEANQSRRREHQYTLLDVLPILSNEAFRQEVLEQVRDRAIGTWWRDNYDHMGRVLQQQTANPVTTKVGRFLVTEASRLVLGQPVSTFDPRPLLRDGGVLVVNSAVGSLGEGAASLVGATVLNLLGLLVEEQVALPPSQRGRLVALVDESSTLGAADYPRMLSELGKYGASFVLVTQSLAKLDAIDEALRPTLFSNIDGLTVFQVSAQDARYLAPELGGELDVPDLTSLDDYECYARWWAEGRRLPAFSLRLDPPPPTDASRLQAIVQRSAERYGRPRTQVAAEIEAVLQQRDPPPTPERQGSRTGAPTAAGTRSRSTGSASPSQPRRSEHRDQEAKS